jgi:transposase InsO family protein
MGRVFSCAQALRQWMRPRLALDGAAASVASGGDRDRGDHAATAATPSAERAKIRHFKESRGLVRPGGRGRADAQEAFRTVFETHAQARMEVFEYIEGWYNSRRRHSALDY